MDKEMEEKIKAELKESIRHALIKGSFKDFRLPSWRERMGTRIMAWAIVHESNRHFKESVAWRERQQIRQCLEGKRWNERVLFHIGWKFSRFKEWLFS